VQDGDESWHILLVFFWTGRYRWNLF